MEIKLTTDWIIMHNSEIFINTEGKACFRIFDNEFQYHLIELALKTMKVNYKCDELFEENDINYDNPSYFFTFENVDDIKNSCPELFNEYQRLQE